MSSTDYWMEMSEMLAEQLCKSYLALAKEAGRSYWLDAELQRLDGCISMIPAAIYPLHLWEEREAPKQAESMLQASRSDEATPGNTNPHAGATNAPQAGQLEIPIP